MPWEKGSGIELDKWIQPGDVIEMEGEGIGILRNRVGDKAPTAFLYHIRMDENRLKASGKVNTHPMEFIELLNLMIYPHGNLSVRQVYLSHRNSCL